MSDKRFQLGDYVEVKDRLAMFYAQYPDGRIVTTDVRATSEPDDVPRVWVEAKAYRTPDDPHPAVGWSWMVLPGSTPYTRGSELENTETSAWGRAIGALGIGIAGGIASAQEVRNKQRSDSGFVDTPRPQEATHATGLIGTVEIGKNPVDMQVRITKEHGIAWGFKLKNGRRSYQVLAYGPLADALSMAGPDLAGQRVEVWGSIDMIPWDKDGKAMPPYPRIRLERIKTAEWTLPAIPSDPEQAAIDTIAPGQESFDLAESARIDAEAAKA